MNKAPANDILDLEAEFRLLQRRFARAEAARFEAETLLEEKSRFLAQANEELSQNRARLARELNQRTRQLLDAQRVAGFGTMIWDVIEGKGELSPHAEAMLGLSGQSILDSIHPMISRVLPEDRDKAMTWVRAVADRALALPRQTDAQACPRSGAASPPANAADDCSNCPDRAACDRGIEVRVAGTSPGRTNRMIRAMAQTEFDDSLQHPVIFVTLQDVTREFEAANEAATLREGDRLRLVELERLTGELRAAREAADAANAAKTRFLAMMSHDIRTPMNGVLGMLELFEHTGLDESQRETLELVKASGEQLRLLLDDIIDLERAEAGKLVLHEEPVDIGLMMKTVIGFWAKAAADKGLDFKLERGAFGLPIVGWAMVDRHRSRQVIDNLLSNAIKHTQTGQITVRSGLVRPGWARLEVIDTGPGIPPERRRELFEDFGQLYLQGSEAGGAGLGLAICKRIIDLKGGQIGVTEGPGGMGCCFWIEVPQDPVDAPERTADPDAMVLVHPDGRRPRILVAEDVQTNRLVAKGLLGKLGCDVELVNDGAQAVAAVQTGQFDLVLMDMSMPVLDGAAATRQIRALDGPAGTIPILALTAYSRPEELAPMAEAGAQGHVRKPIVLEELYRAIAAVCCEAHAQDGSPA